jgi:hypothetical protein
MFFSASLIFYSPRHTESKRELRFGRTAEKADAADAGIERLCDESILSNAGCCVYIFVRCILTEEAVKAAPIEKDRKVVSGFFRPRAEPCSAAVCRQWIEIGMGTGAIFGKLCLNYSVAVLPQSAEPPLTFAYQARI